MLRIPVQVVLLLFALVNAGTVVHGLERGTWAVPVGAFIGRPLGMLIAVGISVAIGLRLPARLGWRELVVIAFTTSCTFTFGLFFATAVFPIGPVLVGLAFLGGTGWRVADLTSFQDRMHQKILDRKSTRLNSSHT